MNEPHEWTLEQVEDLLKGLPDPARVIVEAVNATTHGLWLQVKGFEQQVKEWREIAQHELENCPRKGICDLCRAKRKVEDLQKQLVDEQADRISWQELYEKTNDQLAAERELRYNLDKNWSVTLSEANKTHREQLSAVVELLGECRCKLDWSVTDSEFIERIDALAKIERKNNE